MGLGHPSYFNEELLEQWGLMRGSSQEDAKNTQASGCVANAVMGKAIQSTGAPWIGTANMVTMLEEILYQNDQELSSGCLHLPAGRNVRDMQSADELMEALLKRMLFYTQLGTVSWNIAQQIIMDYKPDPCNSLLHEDTMERGIDLMKFHKENDTWPNVIPFGCVNVSDSLAAIQKLVFDDRKYTMEELLTALQANWAGYEEMRQDFLNAPKFGADDDFADAWTLKFQLGLEETVSQVKDAWGYSGAMDGSTATGYALYGMAAGASPDGRGASEPLADGTRSPMAGTDSRGPTAVLNSAAKIPYLHPELLNQRFMPQFMEGNNRGVFAEYLKEWYDRSTIPHIQFNVLGSDELRDAQEHPENHADLIVRVAGYSAHFVDLPGPTQDSIIARSEQSFV
jgi:pyruvate-formate lyase